MEKEYLKVVREEITEKKKKRYAIKAKCKKKKMMKFINKVKDSKGNNIDLTTKLFDEIAPKYEGRVGGYTRILKIGQRRGDAAEIVRLELI